MRSRLPPIIGCRVLGVLVGLMAMGPQSAWADDWIACAPEGVPAAIVAACTAVIEQGTRSKQDLARAHVRRGFQMERLKQKDSALKDFTRSIELDPTNPAGYMGRGLQHAQRQDWTAALAESSKRSSELRLIRAYTPPAGVPW
jgi:hypothetical protein